MGVELRYQPLWSSLRLSLSFGILRVVINKKWCHVSSQPLLCCSKLMHNKQSSGRLNTMPPWVLMHHSCGMLNLCLFWKWGCILWNFSFFNLLLVLSWTSEWLLFLISVPNLMWWISHERLVLTGDLFFSRKMVGCLITVEKDEGNWGAVRSRLVLKTNLLWRAFSKAFESSRNA